MEWYPNLMSRKGKRFIVLVFGERGVRYGVDRNGRGTPLPRPLMALLYSEKFDNGGFGRFGCEGFFRYSRQNLRQVERLIVRTEQLRETWFPILGIGLAHGRIIGQRNWLGRLKRFFEPDEETLNKAYAAVEGPQVYREVLRQLYDDNPRQEEDDETEITGGACGGNSSTKEATKDSTKGGMPRAGQT